MSEEHEITVTYLEIATGRITHILSVISFCTNAVVLVRLKNNKTPKTPFLIIFTQLCFIDLLYSAIPSTFLAKIFYDSEKIHEFGRTEKEILVNLSGFIWFSKQFATYFFISVLGVGNGLSVYARCRPAKRSAYIVSVVGWCAGLCITGLPLLGGCRYLHSHEQSLFQFNGSFEVIDVQYVEVMFRELPLAAYLLITLCTLDIVQRLLRAWIASNHSLMEYITTQEAPSSQQDMLILPYMASFLGLFGAWVGLVAFGKIEIFGWQHTGHDTPPYLAFCSGATFLTLQCCFSPGIWLSQNIDSS